MARPVLSLVRRRVLPWPPNALTPRQRDLQRAAGELALALRKAGTAGTGYAADWIAERSRQREAMRVAMMLKRSAADREQDERIRLAEAQLAKEGWTNPENLIVGATAEWKAKGEYETIGALRDSYQEREIKTVRRRPGSAVIRLYGAGVLCDDRFTACTFYRRCFENSGLVGSYAVSKLDGGARGERAFGSMARTEHEADARQMFRLCRTVLDARFIKGFDYVVLEDLSLKDAAKLFGSREQTIRQAVRLGSLRLYQMLVEHKILSEKAQDTPPIEAASIYDR